MSIRRLRWLVPVAVLLTAILLAACGDDEAETATTAAPTGTAAAEEEIIVGVSWANFQEERWGKRDEPAILSVLQAAGAQYLPADAGSSPEKQLTDVENLIAQGADVLIIIAQDGVAILPGVQSALDQGIPVIAYDRLIENPGTFYMTFDNVEVGRMQARAVFEQVPAGNYVFIKGDPGDANATFVHGGQLEIIQAAIDAGDIVNVGESFTDAWDPARAQTTMEQFLTENNNDIQAVLSSNDGMATGAAAALTDQGLAGEVALSGQDADEAALNRIALGSQTVSVWKDARELGKAAGEVALALAQGTALDQVPNMVVFDSPGGNALNSILLPPIPITQDNLGVVVAADWITVETLCQGVTPGSVDACP